MNPCTVCRGTSLKVFRSVNKRCQVALLVQSYFHPKITSNNDKDPRNGGRLSEGKCSLVQGEISSILM